MNRRAMMLTALATSLVVVTACKPKAERLMEEGKELNRQGRYEESITRLEEALALTEKKGEPLVRAEVHFELGRARADRRELDKAEWHYKGALAIFTVEEPEDHVDIIDTLQALAIIEDYRGNHEQAQEHFEEVLKKAERAFGKDSEEAGLLWTSFAVNLAFQRKNERALQAWLRAEEILENKLSPHDATMGHIYNGLGNVYFERDELEKAELYYKRSLKIREHALGEGHPYTATTMFNLSRVFAAKGDTAAALEIVKRVQIIRQRRLPRSHPFMQETLEWRAALEALED